MEFEINITMAVFLLVMAVLWYREGRVVKLSLLSQYSRLILVFVAILGAITASDRFLVDRYGNSVLPIPQVAIAIRLAVLIILGGLIVTSWRLRRNL